MQSTMRQPSFDARGQAVPLPADEERRMAEDAIRALDHLDEMGEEAEQRATLEALIRGLDEDRLSDRRRFP
jgi:hypothetical protein